MNNTKTKLPTTNPKIKITYYDDGSRPDVEVDPKDSVDVEIVEHECNLFLEHKGVKVYYAVDDSDPYSVSEYYYTICDGYDDEGPSDIVFDVREIPRYNPNSVTHEDLIKKAIDQGWITEDEVQLPEG